MCFLALVFTFGPWSHLTSCPSETQIPSLSSFYPWRWTGPQQGPIRFPAWRIRGWEKIDETLEVGQWCFGMSITALLGIDRIWSVTAYTTWPCFGPSAWRWHQTMFNFYRKIWINDLLQGVMVFQVLPIWCTNTELMSHTAHKAVAFLFNVRPCAMAFVVCVSNTVINFMLEKTLLLTYRNYVKMIWYKLFHSIPYLYSLNWPILKLATIYLHFLLKIAVNS